MPPTEAESRRTIHSTGFIVLDLLVADGTVAPHVGGTAANVAVNLALLGWDAAVSGLLGADPAGLLIKEQLNEYGVDTSALVNDVDVETPVVIHEVSSRRHRFRFSCPNCGQKYAKFRPLAPASAKVAPNADVLFFDRASVYALQIARTASTSAIVFEPGTPGRAPSTKSLVEFAHLFRASADLELPPEAAAATTAKTQILGLGGNGVEYRVGADAHWRRCPSRVVGDVIDAGGAGDWLTAALLHNLKPSSIRTNSLDYAALDSAVSIGLDFAAACCRHLGTRGFVGTDDWFALSSHGAGLATGVHQPSRSLLSDAKVGCERWFHTPKHRLKTS